MIVRFADIGGIVVHRCWSFLFIMSSLVDLSPLPCILHVSVWPY